jgi:cytochrome c-type biogenesis protein CcmH
MMTRRSWLWALALGIGVGALLVAAVDDGAARTNADRAYDLANDYACPVCDGQSVAESDVSIAREIRREIRTQVDDGRSDGQIRDFLVSSYPDIDLNPSGTGVTALVWIVPVAALVVGAAALAAAFRHWSTLGDTADEGDIALVAETIADRDDSVGDE